MDEQNVPVRPDPTSVIQPQTSGTVQDVVRPAPAATPMSFTQDTTQNDMIPSPYDSLDGDENVESLGTTSVSQSVASNSTETILAQQAPAPKKTGVGVRDRELNKVLMRVVVGGVVVMLLLFGGVTLANRFSNSRPVDPIAGVAEQELTSLSGGDAETLGIETSNSTLLVNGNILTIGELLVSDGTVTSTIALTQGASSQTYTLPDSSGVFCLDSNNCGYLQAGDVPNTTIAGNDGDFTIGTGLALNGSTISNTMTQTSVNNSIGAITLQGTTNRVSITKNGNTFTLSGPQDLGLTDTPTFDSITLTNVGTQNGNVLCDISNNCGYAGGANAFIQNGNTFGAEAVLGTNDSYNLSFETDGVIRATIDTSGNLGITGQFVSGNSGTASNPGFTFVSDQDTGLYRSNANEVAISTGGVNNTTFSTSGVDIAGHLAVGDGASVSSPTALLIDETYTSADAFNCVFGCYGAQIVVRAESGGPGSGIANIALQAAIGDGVTQGNATGIFINSAALGAGATLQNAYGIRIANQTGSVSGYGIEISGATTQALWVGSGGTYTTANQGIAFGSGRDVNLYRSAADVLRTDDSLFVAGNASRFQSSTDSTTALQVLDADGGNPVLSIDTTNERVGIGTASPTTELDVTGDVNISNRLQVGPTGDTVGQCATIFGPLSCDVSLDVANASTETSIASYGIHTATTINPAGANSASNVGAYSQLTLSGTNNYTATNAAVYGLASSSSTSGTISRLIGVQGSAGIFTTSSTANISEAMGLYGAVGVISTVSGGTIENGYGLYIDVASASDTGAAVTTNYGIYVSPQTNTSTNGTANYGIAVGAADTQTLWLSSNADNTSASAGIAFGLSRDTNLYRSAANTLRTDDALSVGDDITVTGDVLPSADDTYDLGSNSNRWRDLYLGPATLSIGTSATDYKISYDTGNNALLFNNDQDDRDFRIAGDTQANLLYVDAGNNRIGIGTSTPGYELDVVGTINASTGINVNGTQVCTASGCIAAPGSGNYIQNGTSIQTNTNFAIQSAAAGSVGAVIRGASGQTANLQEWQSSTGTVLAYISSEGYLNSPRFKENANGVVIGGALTPQAGTNVLVESTGGSNKALVVKGASGQTANLQEWQNSSGAILSYVDASGRASFGSNSTSWGMQAIASGTAITGYTYGGVGVMGQSLTNAGVAMVARGCGACAGNLQEWQNSSGTALASVSASGDITTGANINFTNGYTGNRIQNNGSSGAEWYVSGTRRAAIGTSYGVAGYGSGTSPSLAAIQSSGQTGDLQQWVNSSGSVLGYVNTSGDLYVNHAGNNYLTINSTNSGSSNLQLGASGTGPRFTYDPVDTTLQFQIGGSTRMRLTQGGVLQLNSTGTAGTVEKFRVNNPTTVDNAAAAILSTGATTSKGLVVQGVASQTANLQQWQSSAGTVLTAVDASGNLLFDSGKGISTTAADGNLYIGQSSRAGGTGGKNLYYGSAYYGGYAHEFFGGSASNMTGVMLVTSSQASKIGLTVKGAASQTANLQEWQSSAGTVLASVSSGGNISVATTNGSVNVGTSQAGYISIGTQSDYSATFSNQAAMCINTVCLGGNGSGVLSVVNHTGAVNTGAVYANTLGTNNIASRSNGVTVMQIGEYVGNTKSHVGFNIASASTAAALFSTSGTTTTNLAVRAITSQTANLQEWQNSSSTALASVNASGQLTATGLVSTQTGTANDLYFNRSDTNAVRIKSNWGGSTAYGVQIQPSAGSVTSYASGYGVLIGNAYSSSVTSGNYDILRVYDNAFNPSSGSSQLNGININPIINQTGTASGISRGVYINPTLTSAVDFRGIEIANASGYGLYQSGASVINYLNGVTKIGSNGTAGTVEKLRVNTPTTVDNLAATILSTGATTSKGLVVQGAASQTANLQEWQSSTGTALLSVGSTGLIGSNATGLEHDFGSSVGARVGSYLRLGSGGGGASSGAIRLFNSTFVNWRNAANSANIGIGVNANDTLQLGAAATTLDTVADAAIGTSGTTRKGLVIQGVASQSANLQEWQDSTGALLASIAADGDLEVVDATVNGNLVVDGTATFNGNITVNGKIITGNTSGSTTVAVDTAGAGTGASASISGNDTSGVITINTGTGAAAGRLATITFSSAFPSSPNVVITPKAIPGGGTYPQYHYDSATGTFDLSSFNALTDSSTYTFSYFITD